MMFKAFIFMLGAMSLSSCAILHHVQVSDIDNRTHGRSFSVKVSETGINLSEASSITKKMTNSQAAKNDMDAISNMIAAFQMGPRTGNITFNQAYAESILALVKMECPSGKITGLTSIRETRKYPAISGEIVKINGYCL